MATTTSAPPSATLFYSDAVCEKLRAWAADGSPQAHRRIAKQHAVILGLALAAETPSSLTPATVKFPDCLFESDSSPYSYYTVLTDGLTHIAAVTRTGAFVTAQELELLYDGVVPDMPAARPEPSVTASEVYDPTTNDWLFSNILAPVMTRRYRLAGRTQTVRDSLLAIAAMSDAQLKDELALHTPLNNWLTSKGLLVRGGSTPPAADRLIVSAFPDLTAYNMHKVLRAGPYGPSIFRRLQDYAGPAASFASAGNMVINFVLHRTPRT